MSPARLGAPSSIVLAPFIPAPGLRRPESLRAEGSREWCQKRGFLDGAEGALERDESSAENPRLARGWQLAGRPGRCPSGGFPGYLAGKPTPLRVDGVPLYSGGPGSAPREGGPVKNHLMAGLPLPLPCMRGDCPTAFARQRPGGPLLTHPPTTSGLGLGPRLLPVAAGGPGGALGLGSPGAEGPATPSVEAVTSRRVAGCPHGCGQQAAEVAAPEGAGGHGGGGGPQRHIPA